MHTEYEVRVLDIDTEKIILKLEALGAEKIAEFDYKRRVYNFHPAVDHKWIRLRTDGKKTTLTIKKLESYEIDGTKELEIEVSDFEETNLILNELGYTAHTYQENRRIQYTYNGVEIDIDYWPLIPTYVEVEGPSEEAIYKTVEALGFTKDSCTSRDVEGIYLDYGYDLGTIYNLKLEEERK